MINQNYLKVVFFTITSTLAAALMSSSVKYLSDDLNAFIICFFRCLIGLIIILPFVALNNFKALKTKNFKLQFTRSFINVFSMIAWFYAIGLMQLEKATALGFTTPLFTTILAVVILGEVIRFHRITALIIGFIGILFIIRPGFIPLGSGTILMLMASLSFSVVIIMVKKLTQIDSSLTIIFYQLLIMTPITFIIALFYWENISSKHFFIFIFISSAGLISHWCMAQSLKLSDTTFVMPMQFTKLIWASLIGYYIFFEKPDLWTWIGASIIFISVIYITYRETFIKQNTKLPKNIDRAIID